MKAISPRSQTSIWVSHSVWVAFFPNLHKFIFFLHHFGEKRVKTVEKNLFGQANGVCSTNLLVEIYNTLQMTSVNPQPIKRVKFYVKLSISIGEYVGVPFQLHEHQQPRYFFLSLVSSSEETSF